MVDNFELIAGLLKFENPGDCYYVQLLRRAADDPMIDGKPDPNYHGNNSSFKDYFIRSVEELNSLKGEIFKLCDTFNLRAYIRLNKRTYRGMAMKMLEKIAAQAASDTFSSPNSIIYSSAGRANNSNVVSYLVDVDKEYLPYIDEINFLIVQSRESVKAEDWFYHKIPTKSGLHLIIPKINTQKFNQLWEMSQSRHPSCGLFKLPKIAIHKDNPTILYVPSDNLFSQL